MNRPIHSVIAGTLLFVLLALGDFLPFWMPDMDEMLWLTSAALLLVVWAGFVMLEKGGDERELVHRMNAGRVAYLSGLGVLSLGLVVQGFAHAIDPWLLYALGTMVISKLIARVYSDNYL
jgi:asparagine N-glycosylation enzyme membrane subunit Stt3